MAPLASIVDWDALLQMLWSAALAGIGVSVVFGIGLLGAVRFVDARRDGRGAEAAIYGVLAIAGLAVVAAGIVFGIAVMVGKD